MRPIILTQSLIIIVLVWLLAIYGKDEFSQSADDENINTKQSKIIGNKIWISSESQRSVGIIVQKPELSSFQEQKTFHGILADVNDLIELNKLFKLNNSRLTESKIILKQKKQDLQRMKGLFNSGRKVSARQLELTELAFEEAKRKLSETKSELDAIKQKVTSTWNARISDGLGKNSGLLSAIISRKVDITRFSILSKPKINEYIWQVKSSGFNDSINYKATLLGPSGQSLKGETGETWLLKSNVLNLASGSPVVVYAEDKNKQSGVLVPEDAIVRFAGESWVYLQENPDYFERVILKTTYSNSDGVFSQHIRPDQLIVVVGAQSLLSEELRHQIENENEH